jgi:hypothetical protein
MSMFDLHELKPSDKHVVAISLLAPGVGRCGLGIDAMKPKKPAGQLTDKGFFGNPWKNIQETQKPVVFSHENLPKPQQRSHGLLEQPMVLSIPDKV